jgi:tetratricopeptide (TPR) repeat protein
MPRRRRGIIRVPKSCIETGRPSPSIPPSRGGRWSAWRSRFATIFTKWLRFSAGLYISLAFALLVSAQDLPKERVRFLDGKTELCEVGNVDVDGVSLKLPGIPQAIKFRWWQLAAEDAARLRDRRPGTTPTSPDSEFFVSGLRIRTVDDKVYEGVPVDGAPAGQIWLKNADGKYVIRLETILTREEIKVDLTRAYSPDEVVGILVGRIKPRTPEDYDNLGAQLLRAKLQARAVAAFRVAELLRHPESPEARMVGELIKLRERVDDLAVRKAVFQAEEQALAGEYDAAIAKVEEIEKLLAGHPEALEELKRVRTQLQEFRGIARDERIVKEGYRAAESLLKLKAMDRSVSFADARAWAETKLPAELQQHLRSKFNFSPDDVTVQRVWDKRPADNLLKHAYDSSSWVVLRPELRSAQEWWVATDDRTRYDLLKGLYIEKNLGVLRSELKSCGVCGGTGQIGEPASICPSCQGLKGYRVLIYR